MNQQRVTSKEVLQYVYKLLEPLKRAVSVYNDNARFAGEPKLNSDGKHMIIRHVAGRSGEVQEGVVAILIYTRGQKTREGTTIENSNLTRSIERKAQDWVESLPTGEYLLWSDDTIQTDYDPEAGLYFTSVRLKYRHY